MNAKLAKKLRKHAKTITKGLIITDHRRNPNSNALEVVPTCTRFVYKKLKKLVSHG